MSISEIAYCPSLPNHSIRKKMNTNKISVMGKISGMVNVDLENIFEI